jgi:hypothetical protein
METTMSDFNAPAEVHDVGRMTIGLHKPMTPPPPIYKGTVVECVRWIIAKKHDYPETHILRVPLEAGFIKQEHSYKEVEAIYRRPDFPK